MVSLKNIIEIIKRTPVSFKWLKERLPDNVDIYRYKELRGKSRFNVFKNKIGIVVLIPKKGEKVGHFVVLLARKNHIEYFSSLGNSMEAETKQLGVSPDTFRDLFGHDYIYNRNKLQKNKYFSHFGPRSALFFRLIFY